MNNRLRIYITPCLVVILAITACTEQPELEYSKAEYASYTDFLNDTEFPYTRKTAVSAESIAGHLHKLSNGTTFVFTHKETPLSLTMIKVLSFVKTLKIFVWSMQWF